MAFGDSSSYDVTVDNNDYVVVGSTPIGVTDDMDKIFKSRLKRMNNVKLHFQKEPMHEPCYEFGTPLLQALPSTSFSSLFSFSSLDVIYLSSFFFFFIHIISCDYISPFFVIFIAVFVFSFLSFVWT